MEAAEVRDKILGVHSWYSPGTQKFYFCWIPGHRLHLQNAKIPWRKVGDSTNYPDVFFFPLVKVPNIWILVPIQVIGWVWPFSSGDLAWGKHSLGGRDFVCMWWSAKLDNLLLIQLPLGAKDGDKICLSPLKQDPPQTHCFRWHCSKEAPSTAGTVWLLVSLLGNS